VGPSIELGPAAQDYEAQKARNMLRAVWEQDERFARLIASEGSWTPWEVMTEHQREGYRILARRARRARYGYLGALARMSGRGRRVAAVTRS
jgi:hypothetical protein